MTAYRFRPDGSMGLFGTADNGLVNGPDKALTRAANVVLRDNNPVGVAAGCYDDALTVAALSEFFLSNLGYTESDFVQRTGASLAAIMVNSALFPFSAEIFRALSGNGCFYMLAADGTPRLMYVVKKDITDEAGRVGDIRSLRSAFAESRLGQRTFRQRLLACGLRSRRLHQECGVECRASVASSFAGRQGLSGERKDIPSADAPHRPTGGR